MPAKAGIQGWNVSLMGFYRRWTPAFAGVTELHSGFPTVSKAGIQIRAPRPTWVPAFAGMTDPPTGLLVQSPFQERELGVRASARAGRSRRGRARTLRAAARAALATRTSRRRKPPPSVSPPVPRVARGESEWGASLLSSVRRPGLRKEDGVSSSRY